tara:strand:+ start:380 stop:646 length:267 start_codon:yes stop_codon:yes gene_type:complete
MRLVDLVLLVVEVLVVVVQTVLEEQETLLPQVHLKEIMAVQVLEDLLQLVELAAVAAAVVHKLVEMVDPQNKVDQAETEQQTILQEVV